MSLHEKYQCLSSLTCSDVEQRKVMGVGGGGGGDVGGGQQRNDVDAAQGAHVTYAPDAIPVATASPHRGHRDVTSLSGP